mmetsp:Transcript_2664/g.5646  ORF Transcript_2664/g.5646 Transcript_2664/m.5646 type:complete len:256 (-) Transcript_2664:969-1736(-)
MMILVVSVLIVVIWKCRLNPDGTEPLSDLVAAPRPPRQLDGAVVVMVAPPQIGAARVQSLQGLKGAGARRLQRSRHPPLVRVLQLRASVKQQLDDAHVSRPRGLDQRRVTAPVGGVDGHAHLVEEEGAGVALAEARCAQQRRVATLAARLCSCAVLHERLRNGEVALGARYRQRRVASVVRVVCVEARCQQTSDLGLVLEVNRGHEHARSELVRRVERSAFLVQTPHQVEVAAVRGKTERTLSIAALDRTRAAVR